MKRIFLRYEFRVFCVSVRKSSHYTRKITCFFPLTLREIVFCLLACVCVFVSVINVSNKSFLNSRMGPSRRYFSIKEVETLYFSSLASVRPSFFLSLSLSLTPHYTIFRSSFMYTYVRVCVRMCLIKCMYMIASNTRIFTNFLPLFCLLASSPHHLRVKRKSTQKRMAHKEKRKHEKNLNIILNMIFFNILYMRSLSCVT